MMNHGQPSHPLLQAPIVIRSNTEVFIRIRPEEDSNTEHFKVLEDQKTVYVRCWQDFSRKRNKNQVPNYLQFETNGVFYNISQSYVFDQVTKNGLFDKLIYGNAALILSYGQTGSGKTLTTSGLECTYEDRGLIPRVLEKFFRFKEDYVEKFQLCLKMQYVETNRTYLVNLLDDEDILYDMNSYKNIKPIKVKSLQHGMKLIFKAEAHKTVKATEQYKSNMANSIVTFYVYTKGHNTAVSEGTLHIVDLAGIDTIGNSSCLHKNGYEVGNGNLAKSQIEQLILVLNENYSKTAGLKHRLCIIIHYLRNVLNPNSLIKIIGHVRIHTQDLKICTSMLRFACSIKEMVPKKLSRFLETSIDVQFQVVNDELKALKKEMDLNAMLSNEDMSYNLSDERLDYIQQLAMEYLDGATNSNNNELVLLSTTDTVLVMKVIKNIYQKLVASNKELTIKKASVNSDSRPSRELRAVEASSDASKPSRKTPSAYSSTTSMVKPTKTSTTKKPLMAAPSRISFTVNKARRSSKSISDMPRENYSTHSLKSKTSKTFGMRKRSRFPHETSRQGSDDLTGSVVLFPEEIPAYTTAWAMFLIDIKSDQTIDNYDIELEALTKVYLKEVKMLEDMNNISNKRKNELDHAIMIKEIDTDPHNIEDLREFQRRCLEMSTLANKYVLEQKEKILKLQAEMRLLLDHRAKQQVELKKKYDEYCMQRFKVLIPNIASASSLKVDEIKMTDSDAANDQQMACDGIYVPEAETNYDVIAQECVKNVQFNKMKNYMKREFTRVQNKKKRNQKWMSSFHVEYQD